MQILSRCARWPGHTIIKKNVYVDLYEVVNLSIYPITRRIIHTPYQAFEQNHGCRAICTSLDSCLADEKQDKQLYTSGKSYVMIRFPIAYSFRVSISVDAHLD